MKRRDLLQSLIGVVGAATAASPLSAVERPANYDASKELVRLDWKPSFLDDHQNETLIVLSDLIIPATDTPGAKSALVNRFLDKLMASERNPLNVSFCRALLISTAKACGSVKPRSSTCPRIGSRSS